ncbi:MAG: TonB-dependent receptor [Lewinellaceae bacterium]|nr:TonB-dependent receptor [Lewinellaceae bacterium]
MKQRFTYLVLLFLFCSGFLLAQNGKPTRISGSVVDSTGAALPAATVMLLQARDSALVQFTLTDNQGQFNIPRINTGEYFLQISYVGFANYQQNLTVTGEQEIQDVGRIQLEPQSQLIQEITVAGDRIPIGIKKDTIEYNASAFQVQPNANVEDLLKKLPGVEVDRSGNIQAQGENVQRVLVDGKEFFGRDPKMATRNLPADAIDKVQVFDKKSDQAEFTGVDDGNQEKTINLSLKEDRKKGAFGNITLGGGDQERYQGKATLNKFSGQQQLSLIGMANNINEQGFSFEDYIGFTGGFSRGGGGGVRININGGDDSEIPLNTGNNTGFTDTYSGGINFNQEFSDKTELNASYAYSLLDRTIDGTLYRENFLADRTFFNDESSNQDNRSLSHRLNMTFDHKFDSLQSVRLTSRLTARGSDRASLSESLTLGVNLLPINGSMRNNTNDGGDVNWSNDLLYRRRFGKAGRTFSANFTFNLNNDYSKGLNQSYNSFYTPVNVNIDTLLQDFRQDNDRLTYGVRMVYTEPLSKSQNLEFSYNYRHNTYDQVRNVYDLGFIGDPNSVFNTQLSNLFASDYNYHVGGLNYRIAWPKVNLTLGSALQYSELTGNLILSETKIDRTFTNLLPTFRFRWEMKRSQNLNVEYQTSVREPSLSQLQPLVDNSNPLNIYVGNPSLRPEYAHRFDFRYFSFNQFSLTNFFAFANLTYTQNRIRNAQTIDEQLITTTTPVNVASDYLFFARLNFGTRIRPLNMRIGLNGGINYNQGLTFVNAIENQTSSTVPTGGVSLENQKKDFWDWRIGTNVSYTTTNYSIAENLNRDFITYTHSAELNIPMLKKALTLSSNLDYQIYQGLSDGFNQEVPIWNASLAWLFLKDKKGQLKLGVTDILNRNTGISRTTEFNYTQDQRILSLGRYLMMSFTYSLKGMGGPGGPGGMRIMIR